jgi:hypothetical protein
MDTYVLMGHIKITTKNNTLILIGLVSFQTFFTIPYWYWGARIAQLIYLQAGWHIWPGGKRFSFLYSIKTGSWEHSVSCLMGTGGSSLGGKLTIHLHLMSWLRIHTAIPSTPIHFHGAVLNEAQGQLYLLFVVMFYV